MRLVTGMTALVVLAAALSTGCVWQRLDIATTTVTPDEVTIGNAVLVTAEVNDPHGSVASVIAVVREVPEMAFELFDDGQEGDVKADDGVWSCKLVVPAEALPGTYHFDITAYGPAGDEITVRRSTGEVVPVAAASSVTIVY